MIGWNFNQIIITCVGFIKSLVINKHLTIWQRCHLQSIFGNWKSTILRWIYFPRPSKIKIGYWKLTIYDGNMFHSNESSGIIIPRIKRLIWVKNWCAWMYEYVSRLYFGIVWITMNITAGLSWSVTEPVEQVHYIMVEKNDTASCCNNFISLYMNRTGV